MRTRHEKTNLLNADDEVDNGDIGGGDTERHAGELAVKGRNDLADGLKERDEVKSAPTQRRGSERGDLWGCGS